ncbi:MAG: CapA family protein [Ruminococcus sp.]|nr:CapA family protein [Ruminococcus sp.]
MKGLRKKIAAAFCAAVIALTATGCGNEIYSGSLQKSDNSSYTSFINSDTSKQETSSTDSSSAADPQQTSATDPASQPETPPAAEPSYKASLICVGDNLIHDNIYIEAEKKAGEKGKYNFDDCYKPIESYIKGNDLAIVNQETIVTDTVPPESFPTFASPKAVADKVKALGFNVVSMCNNHVLDQGEAAIQDSLKYWDSLGILHYGVYADQADCDNIKTKEINGIKFAFVGYMEHTNGLSLPEGAKATYIRLAEEEKVKAQIQKADKMADVVVVSCHYGTEISNELNAQQETITPKLVEWGADLIIGTQAHALSTSQYIDKADGTKAFVFYGLGNFLNTMDDKNSVIGLMGKLNVVKDKNTGKVSFENVKCIPVISHFEGLNWESDWYNCTIYPYAKYTDELFAKHYVASHGFTRSYVDSVLSTYVPKEFLSIE